jgi:hypothetical protein
MSLEVPGGMTEEEWLSVKWLSMWMKKETELTEDEKLLRKFVAFILHQDDLILRCLIVVFKRELDRRKERRNHSLETLHR